MELIDLPRPVSREMYDAAVIAFVERVRQDSAVIAVYQFGAVSCPGISDIDLLVVIEDGRRTSADPLSHSDATGRYLFTHSAFGVSRALFREAVRLFPFGGLTLLWGEDLADGSSVGQCGEAIARQTALEFLLANYFTRSVEARYGLLSVRGALLSTYALRHDLSILGAASSPLADRVAVLGEWRNRWFEKEVRPAEIRGWFEDFRPTLTRFLEQELSGPGIALPRGYRGGYARHIRVVAGPRLEIHHRGFVLPSKISRMGRRVVRAQHRWNRFEFVVPATVPPQGSDLDLRFAFFRSMVDERDRLYPRYGVLATPWVVNVS